VEKIVFKKVFGLDVLSTETLSFETVPNEEAKTILVQYRPGRQRKDPRWLNRRANQNQLQLYDEEGGDYVATDII
jgi:hypothetical protein